jgi:hypothetical protein
MTTGRAVRAMAAVAMAAGVALVAPKADAATGYAIDIQLSGVPGGGNYNPGTFSWGGGDRDRDPLELAFTHTTDASSVVLMGLARQGGEIGSATLHVKLNGGAANITIQMNGVRIQGIKEADNTSASDTSPQETVYLRFRSVTYTFQPVNLAGQPSGPPVTFQFGGGGDNERGKH